MSKNEKDYLKEKFKQAADIASVVPKTMQPMAFSRALDSLQGNIPPKHQEAKIPKTTPVLSVSDTWFDHLNRTEYPEISDSSTVLERSLQVLKIAREAYGVEWLTPTTISRVLSEKFRVNTEPKQVSDKLGGVRKLANRRKAGKGYEYSIMQPGESYITKGQDAQREATTSRKRKQRVVATLTKTANKSKATRKNISSRLGPKSMIDDLLSEGFFDQPKIVGEIIDFARENLGYSYIASELSPALVRLTRSKILGRKRNNDSQYEYTKR